METLASAAQLQAGAAQLQVSMAQLQVSVVQLRGGYRFWKRGVRGANYSH